MEATNNVEDAVIRQKGGSGWDGSWQLEGWELSREGGGSKWRACGGTKSHRRGRGLRWGLRLRCCRELRLGLGLSGAGWGGTLGWGLGRAREGGGGATAGGLGVRQVSGPPSRGGSRRRRGVQRGLGGG